MIDVAEGSLGSVFLPQPVRGDLPRPYSDWDVVDLEKDAYHLLRSLGQGLFHPPPLPPDHQAHLELQKAIELNRQRLGRAH